MPAFFTFNVSIQDGILPKPHTSTVSINFQGGETLAWNADNLQDVSDWLLPIIDDMIDGKIVSASWNYVPALVGGLKADADVNSDVEEGALFMFQSLYPYKTRVRIPTFKESQMLESSKQVDVANTEVAAFIAAMVDGFDIVTLDFNPADARGEDVTALISAVDAFQKDRG